jgi:hypothetical protein
MLRIIFSSLALALLISAGLGHDRAARPKVQAQEKPKTIVVVGKLTDEGVECRALRAEDGTLYTLVGELNGFKVGDKVRVVGQRAEISTCMQGTTLSVKNIKRAK